MPTYNYECSECDHSFELFQSMSDEPVKVCPKCNGAVKRLIGTGSGIIFKGGGFYQTDYKSSNPDLAAKPSGDKGTAPCGKADICGGCTS